MMVQGKREGIPADQEGIYMQNRDQCALNRPYRASIRPNRTPLSELWHASTMCNVRCGDSLLLDSLGVCHEQTSCCKAAHGTYC